MPEKIGLLPDDFEYQFYDRTAIFAQYSLRWERTPTKSEIINCMKNSKVAVSGDVPILQTPNGQHMALMAANLISRFCPNIDFLVSKDTPSLIGLFGSGGQSLVDSLLNVSRSANPLGNFDALPKLKKQYDGILQLGPSPDSRNATSVCSDGWRVYLNTCHVKHEQQNPVGAQLAACLGAAEIFKAIARKIGGHNPEDVAESEPLSLSCFDFCKDGMNPALPRDLSIDEAKLVGGGAIGNAVVYCLRTINELNGSLSVIDPQELDISNLNRYVLATWKDALSRRSKVDLLASFSSTYLKINPYLLSYQDFSKELEPNQLVAVGVDDVQTRWDVQNDFPQIILNAGTDVDFVSVSRHNDFMHKACLGCLNPTDWAPSATQSAQPFPAISFTSAISGILMCAELIKENVPAYQEYVLNNELTFKTMKFGKTLRIRKPDKSLLCGCRCQNPNVIDRYLQRRKQD